MKESSKLIIAFLLVLIGATLTYLFNAWGIPAVTAIWLPVILFLLVIFRREISERMRSWTARPKRHDESPDSVSKPLPSPEVCEPGPYSLLPGAYEAIPLNVSPGDHIVGRVEEEDGDDFDWYIVDEPNLVAFKNRYEPDAIDMEEKATASLVDAHVEGLGPWFLLLSNERRQIERIIEVHLRRE